MFVSLSERYDIQVNVSLFCFLVSNRCSHSFPLPAKDIFSINMILLPLSSMEPVKEVGIETKIDMEVSVLQKTVHVNMQCW